MKKINVKQIVKDFKNIMLESSKFYHKTVYEINYYQFQAINDGRVSKGNLALLGGYVIMRQFVFPQEEQTIDPAAKTLLLKLLKND